jgi:hypothetical protein
VIARTIARLIAFAVLGMSTCATQVPPAQSLAHAIPIAYERHRLSGGGDIDHVGRLIYRGGLELSSPERLL